jgi:hypothetical protein
MGASASIAGPPFAGYEETEQRSLTR